MSGSQRIAFATAAASALLMSVTSDGHAQPYPSRPVRLVVPYVPRGGSDFVGRTLALKLSEAALPGYEQSAWHGLLAPAGLPQAITDKLNTDLGNVLRHPDLVQRFATQGFDVIGGSPVEFATFIKQDVAKYQKLVKTAGIRID